VRIIYSCADQAWPRYLNFYGSVVDPDLGFVAFLTPGSGIRDGKKSDPDPGSRMIIPDNFSENLDTVFRVTNT
jgi:hypothetical protein